MAENKQRHTPHTPPKAPRYYLAARFPLLLLSALTARQPLAPFASLTPQSAD